MEQIPVYFFTGFMDSGKTSLIVETLIENEFSPNAKNLIIACEDGDIEYDEEKLKNASAQLAVINSEDEFTAETFKMFDLQYRPDAVFIEYNGTWEYSYFENLEMPKEWVLVQSLCTIDASTFDLYMTNMRPMMREQFFMADVVIFNRCTDKTDKSKFRRMIKALNRKAQMVYERVDGTIDDSADDAVPFDFSQPEIAISDDDYGLWYLDALDHPKRYDGKSITFLAKIYRPEKLKKGVFVPGRFAMTCCEDDITFIGFKCKSEKAPQLEHRGWYEVKVKVRVEFAREYKGKGPVLYLEDFKPAPEPADELVYFS